MPANTLPVSRLINVSVILTPPAAQTQNLNTLLILGSSSVIDVVSRLRSYTDIEGVVEDFGTTLPEYFAAALWFEQQPQPTTLYIGRWAKTATAGQLFGAPLTVAQQNVQTVWVPITNGGFHIQVDGGGSTNVTGLNFSGATTMAGVAAIISAGLAGATCIWDAGTSQFIITSATTGATSAIGFLTAPTAGTNISATMGAAASSSGAYVANGIVPESAVSCVALFDGNYGQTWYAAQLLGGVSADYVAIGQYIEATGTKHIQGCTTQEAAALTTVDTTSLPYLLNQLNLKRSITQYSSTNAYAIASALSRLITVNYGGNNTTLTLMYKQEPGIVPENLTENQAAALESKNCNVVAAYDNDTAIFETGVMASGDFADTITGTDWLAVTIMTAVYNLLYTSPTKIPQTDAGTALICTTIANVCSQGVSNGLIAPGVWNSGGFGSLNQGDYLSKGFYIYANPIATQNQADRAARRSPPIQVAVKLAGAIHTVDVIVNVNQ